jgi:hypothetical protein
LTSPGDRPVRAHRKKQRRPRQCCDRHEILLRIVRELTDEQRTDGQQRGVDDQERVAVRRRRGYHGGRNTAIAAGAVFHHHGLADPVLQTLGEQTRGRVRHATGRIGHDQPDALTRIGRLTLRRQRQAKDGGERSYECSARDQAHWILMGRLCKRSSPTDPP